MMKKLSQGEMNLVYPQTSNNWANEVDTTWFAEECDLDEDGWLDPWSRPLDKNLFKDDENSKEDDLWIQKSCTVYLEYRGTEYPIRLLVYTWKLGYQITKSSC